MKIAYVLPLDFEFERKTTREALSRFHFSTEYARRMASRGNEVTLYCLDRGLQEADIYGKDGFIVKTLPVNAHFPPFGQSGNAHSLLLAGEIARDNPEVIHYHNYLSWNYLYNVPFLKARHRPLIAQYHGRPDPLVAQRAYIFWPVFKLADRYLVSSESEAERLRKMFRVQSERVDVFPNVGIDCSLFRPILPRVNDPQFLYVGRIPLEPHNLWEKSPTRILLILKALAIQGASFRLTVAGDGPGTGGFLSLAERLGLKDSVEVKGYVPQERLPSLYSRSWLTFVPMRMDEIDINWDGSLKESLACGTPVAAFNDESPHFGDLGLLLPSEPESAALMLASFVKDPNPLFDRTGRGPDIIRASCDWDVVVDRLERIYKVARKEISSYG